MIKVCIELTNYQPVKSEIKINAGIDSPNNKVRVPTNKDKPKYYPPCTNRTPSSPVLVRRNTTPEKPVFFITIHNDEGPVSSM